MADASFSPLVSIDKSLRKPLASSRRRLSSRYLWFAILIAVLPLIALAVLYDAYFSQLVSRLAQEKLATQLASTQNEVRVFLRERKYELEALADQFDSEKFFQPEGYQLLPTSLETLLRLQTDASTSYGVAFLDENRNISWTFPAGVLDGLSLPDEFTAFEGVSLQGPSHYSINRPASLMMTKPIIINGQPSKQSIGLIIRFNSITEIMSHLELGGAYYPALSLASGRSYDIVGQPLPHREPLQKAPLIGDWELHLIQNQRLVSSSMEQIRFWLILLVGVVVMALLFLHWSISRRLDKQVDRLVSSVEQVASGDLDTPIDPVGKTELARLTSAIDTMRNQLRAFINSTVQIERQASIGRLAAGLAHDIRNPLATIRTTIGALARREKNEDNRDMLNMIDGEIQRVNDVMENLMNFARPREPLAEVLVLSEQLDTLALLLSASAREARVELIFECPPKLTLWADAGHVRQVLINLSLNALQAMNTTGGQLVIRASANQERMSIVIRDSGPGIPPDKLRHISEPFFTTKPAGTGLGLAICSRLIHNNGGTMDIRSQVGCGTTVIVTLPAASKVGNLYE
ncbi:MAG: sensor histidine kinase [Pontibacterium sp.]